MRHGVGKIFGAVTIAAALTLSACASTDGGGGDRASGADVARAGIIGDQSDPGDPVDGGALVFAGYSTPTSLDPAITQPAGTTGGTEMASVYDVLMRWDDEAEQVVPQLAESLSDSDDHLTWTLKLRDGVEFSDGTALDADAVVGSIERFNAEGGPNSEQFLGGVESVTAVDGRTVEFRLTDVWSEFPVLLSFGHGMIVAPAGYADPERFEPIGAGPFTVTSFEVGDRIDMAPREDYWDGRPHLARLQFVAAGGDQARIDNLSSGDVDMAYLRSAEWVSEAQKQYPGYYNPLNVNDVLQINNAEGRPGADENVRQAIAHAIDPEVINTRAFDGFGHPTTKVFAEWSIWHNDVPGFEQDVDKARELLDKARDNGYDGRLVYAATTDPVAQGTALATQAMLEAVGFDVEIEYAPSVVELSRRVRVDHDYDIAYGSYSVPDSVPTMRLEYALRSDSRGNILGYDDPDMDALLDTAKHAMGEDETREALRAVEQKIHDDVPFLTVGWGSNYVAWQSGVHGVVPSTDAIMLLGKAWVQ